MVVACFSILKEKRLINDIILEINVGLSSFCYPIWISKDILLIIPNNFINFMSINVVHSSFIFQAKDLAQTNNVSYYIVYVHMRHNQSFQGPTIALQLVPFFEPLSNSAGPSCTP